MHECEHEAKSELLVGCEAPLFSRSAISLQLRRLGYPDLAISSFERCGQIQSENTFIIECGCGSRELPMTHRCNLRTCPRCARTRKRRLKNQFLPYLVGLKRTQSTFLYFLTISPDNYVNLKEGLSHLRSSFVKFLRSKYVSERISGGFYVIETKGKENSYNVHLHAIVYGRYLDNRIRGKCLDCGQNLIKFDPYNRKPYCANRNCNSTNVFYKQDSKIVELFRKISDRDVNINVTTKHVDKRTGRVFRLNDNLEYCVNYLLKYVGQNKDDFVDDEQMAQYMFDTRKQKLISSWGLFFHNKPVKMPDICHVCGEEILYLVDFEAMRILHSTINPP